MSKIKAITAGQIIDNLNARIKLLKSQGFDKHHLACAQLQEMLDDICRHGASIENIEASTARHTL